MYGGSCGSYVEAVYAEEAVDSVGQLHVQGSLRKLLGSCTYGGYAMHTAQWLQDAVVF